MFDKFFDRDFSDEIFNNVRFGLVEKLFLPLLKNYPLDRITGFITRHHQSFNEVLSKPINEIFDGDEFVLDFEYDIVPQMANYKEKIKECLISIQEKTCILK